MGVFVGVRRTQIGGQVNYDSPPEGGACKGHPTDWWYPLLFQGAGGGGIKEQKWNMAQAKAICETCDVRVPCLEYSLRHEPLGVWGGHDERERHIIRRRRKIAVSRSGVPRGIPN